MIATFVYGTLRIGEGNYAWASADVVDEIENCTANGGLYFFTRWGAFPVADFTESGTIHGDLLFYEEDSINLMEVAQMEIGAGYIAAETDVTTPYGEVVRAIVWHWPRETGRGPKITHGDWKLARSQGFSDSLSA